MTLVQASPSATNTPSVYGINTDNNGNWLIQGVTRDGQQEWQQLQQPVPGGRDSQGRLPLLVQSVADGSGGLLLLFCDPSLFQNACQLTDLDGQTGSFAWQYTSPHGFNGSFAVRQDGAVIITEYDQVSYDNWLVMFNGTTGQRTPLMDLSPLGGGGGATGPPAVDTNGNTYVLYDDLNGQNVDLLTVQPDGSASTQQIATSPNVPYPGEVIPDGQGGQLATWTYQSGDLFPFELTQVTSQGSSTFALPLNGDYEARTEAPHQLSCCSMDVLISADSNAAGTYNNGDANGDPKPQITDSDPAPYTGFGKNGKAIHWETTTSQALTKCLGSEYVNYGLTACAAKLNLSRNLTKERVPTVWAKAVRPREIKSPLSDSIPVTIPFFLDLIAWRP